MKKKTKIEIVKITYDCVYIYLLDCKKKKITCGQRKISNQQSIIST